MNAIIFALALATANALMVPSRHISSHAISERLFGKSRTWEGALIFTITGTLLLMLFYGFFFSIIISLLGYTGTLLNSYTKRKLGIKNGESFLPFDQIDFIILPLIFQMNIAPSLMFAAQAISTAFFTHFIGNLALSPIFKKQADSTLKSKFLPSSILFFLSALTLSSMYAGNIAYTLINPILFGTSVGKTALFLLGMSIILLPWKLNPNKKWLAIAAIILCIITAALGHIEAKALNEKHLPEEQISTIKGIRDVHFTVYEPETGVKYSTTNLYHTHLLKGITCLIPFNDMDLCSPVTHLIDRRKLILPGILFLLALILSLTACLATQGLQRIKLGITLICLLISTIDGGLLTPQFAFFAGLTMAVLINKWYTLILPALFIIIRNQLLGVYPSFGIDSLATFIFLPAAFLIKKRTWLFVIAFLAITLTASALQYAKIDALTPDTATTFKGDPTLFNFEYENITMDSGLTTIRFHSNDSWKAYNSIYAQDKGMSFKSFLAKQERCAITENIAYLLTNQTINSTIINILSQNVKNKVLQLQYQCACTDCNLIPAIEARKALNTNYIVQVNYIMYPQ